MKLHFDPNQQFQLDAIEAILGIFEGQPLSRGDFDFSFVEDTQMFRESVFGVGNRLALMEDQVLENLKTIQKKNGLAAFKIAESEKRS